MKHILYIGILFTVVACGRTDFQPEAGDLLFQAGIPGGMTDAIAEATGGQGDISFTHVGIATIEPSGIYVLEATPEKGVSMTPLQEFLDAADKIADRPAVVVARLHHTDGKKFAAQAVVNARHFLGQPYDESFLPHNDKMYCSELIWESYLNAEHNTHLFAARPMTFCGSDGQLSRFWADHFASLDEAVPEGVLGTNPDDLSRAEILQIVHRYYQ